MIFIANTLELNGGTTFLLRTCKELSKRGIKPTILVLFGHDASEVGIQLGQIARVITLKSLVLKLFSLLCVRQLGVFLPFASEHLRALLGDELKSIHVMGIFGLLVAKRLSKSLGGIPITIGIYHQNEFLFSGGNGYFVRWVSKALSETSGDNLVFFNDANRQSYAKQFNEHFLLAPVLPIGIEFPEAQSDVRSEDHVPLLIVSVGNLVKFKTYNRHIITCLPELKIIYPNVRYEIYGTGDELEALQALAIEQGVADKVTFCGGVDYARYAEVVSRAAVFIGSGTAILEAAVLGVPSIVGIESIQEPLTYGFISDVNGYAYNEAGLDLPLVPIIKTIQQVFEADKSELQRISEACIGKAKQFGVGVMVDGLLASEQSAKPQRDISRWQVAFLFISFCWITVLDLFGIDRRFRFRRNQSWGA